MDHQNGRVIPGIHLDRAAATPLPDQLAHGLRLAIVTGALRGGDPLPSTRALAADLGVARGTVVAAYETLSGEGYLDARTGVGTVVAALPATAMPRPPLPVAASPRVVPVEVDLRPGRPGVRGLADAAWRSAWRRATSLDPAAGPGEPAGLPDLREQIARHLHRTRGLDVPADDVIVAAGTSEAMLLTVSALAPRGGRLRIGIENPGYPRVRRVLYRWGAETVPIPVRFEGGIDLEALEARDDLDAVVVTPHHHYPLGSRLDAADRARLLAWSARTGAVVIEDDYDSEFPHGRVPLPPLRLHDPARTVLVGSFSKVLTPALRCGWVVASGDLREALLDARSDLDMPVSLVQQQALAFFLAGGALPRHVARRRREYRHRRRLLLDAFAELDGVSLAATDGGLHAVVLFDGRRRGDESAVVAQLAARGIRVSPLSSYDVPGEPVAHAPGIVFGYAEPSSVVFADAVATLVQVLSMR